MTHVLTGTLEIVHALDGQTVRTTQCSALVATRRLTARGARVRDVHEG
jgi:hypothetical protein